MLKWLPLENCSSVCFSNPTRTVVASNFNIQLQRRRKSITNIMMPKLGCFSFWLMLVIGVAVAIEVQKFGYLFNPPQAEHPQHHEEKQDLNKIPGVPGVDYPVYHEVPHTHFSCHNVPATPGMYANVETGCQAYHVCHDGREGEQGAKFLCTNGTIFNQKEFACDWWYNVKCEEATNFYHLNADPEHNPYFPKKKPELEPYANDIHDAHKFLIQA